MRQFTATDCDSGNNSLLDYSVSGGNGNFAINSTGHLTTNAVLDRENISFYNLMITATDNGLSTRLSSSIQVTYLKINLCCYHNTLGGSRVERY